VIRFVIPAYDEADNVPRLMGGLEPCARRLGAEVIVVDDGSTDDTVAAIEAHARDLRLVVVRHERNRGLGAALDTGLRAALAASAGEDAIVTLEADGTSDLADLPRMLERLDAGRDVVLASVHAHGGGLVGVDTWRLWASRAVSGTFRVLGGLREVHTLSSVYRVYRARALGHAAEVYGDRLVRERGFAASVELLLKLHRSGASIAEVPTVNDWTQRRGESKAPLLPTVLAYSRLMATALAGRI
jgi:dolichol-phosphate mannosyltransferase